MKRLLILITLSMALAAGCQTDSDAKLHPQGEFVLSVALSPTRVSLGDKSGDGYSVYWNDGDRLVVNGIESNEAMIDADDRSKAQFEFSDGTSLTYPFNITYPHCATTTATKPMVGFSAEQRYVEGSIEVGSAPMCGYVTSAGEAITLKHLATILHLPVVSKDEGVILDRVVVTSKRKIAGAFEVDCSGATISATESCGTVVTYELPENFTSRPLRRATFSSFCLRWRSATARLCLWMARVRRWWRNGDRNRCSRRVLFTSSRISSISIFSPLSKTKLLFYTLNYIKLKRFFNMSFLLSSRKFLHHFIHLRA
jgi:phage baseplate assembly protein gpV